MLLLPFDYRCCLFSYHTLRSWDCLPLSCHYSTIVHLGVEKNAAESSADCYVPVLLALNIFPKCPISVLENVGLGPKYSWSPSYNPF